MGNNNKSGEDISKDVIRFLHPFLVLGGIIITVLGAVLLYVKTDNPKLISVVSQTIVTIGTTILASGIIQLFYERWRDNIINNKIGNIPTEVKKEIQNSIEEIVHKIISLYKPAHPIKIYPESQVPEMDFQEDLVNDLLVSENFVYSGVQMTVATKCLDKAFEKGANRLTDLHFFLPKPENKMLTKADLKAMNTALLELKKTLITSMYSQEIRLKFTLLDIYPPFHIHQTDNRIWFASVLLNSLGKPYPTTYLYERQTDNGSDSMFETLKRMTNVLLADKKKSGKKGNLCIEMSAGGYEANNRNESFDVSKKDITFDELVSRIEKRIGNLEQNTMST